MAFVNNFDPQAFWSLIGGRPAIEAPRLQLENREEAQAFLKAYGYDLSLPADQEKAWLIHSRAITYLRTRILKPTESLPDLVADPRQLKDLTNLLLWASLRDSRDHESLQKWSCAVLRVMHVVAHLHNDLFSYFSAEIQEEIFKPYRQFVQNDGNKGIALIAPEEAQDVIHLRKFDIKPFKESNSSITKLLAKPEEVAFGLLDKIGVRFVTQSLFDVFRVMQFLVRHHVVSFPHVVPSQTNNTLYPVDLFLQVMEGLPKRGQFTNEQIDKLLKEKLVEAADGARYHVKPNLFTSKDYQFVKFINRQLVRVTMPGSGRDFTFFYPYEVQIIDSDHFDLTLNGSASHGEYKARQRQRARGRILGSLINDIQL
jgi:uncharacterized protein (TIGR04562 family)